MLVWTVVATLLAAAIGQHCHRENFMKVCQECPSDAQLFIDNVCRKAKPIYNCWVYTIENERVQCAICVMEYHVVGGICVQNMPFCVEQKDSRCEQCKPEYSLKNGTCMSKRFNATAWLPHCQQILNYHTCLKCEPGYQLTEGKCSVNSVCDRAVIFKGCAQYANNECTACQANFQLNERARCVQVRVENCLRLSNGKCEECDLRKISINEVYKLVRGACVKSVSKIPNCIREGHRDCLQCSIGYALSNGSCTATTKRLARVGRYLYAQWQRANNITTANLLDMCLQKQNDVCVKCQSSYVLDQKLRCVRNLTELLKLRLMCTYSTNDEPSRRLRNIGYWRPNPTGTSWLMMRSIQVYRVWGIELRPNPILTMRLISVIVSYEVDGRMTCYSDCQPLMLQFVDGVYRYTFSQAILTSSIRVVLARWAGDASFQLDAFYSTFVLQDPKLRLASQNSDLFSSGSLTKNEFALRITPRFTGNGYRLASNSTLSQYVGYRCKLGVMRIRRFFVQIGSENEWFTEFIVKYSMDGVKFYCVDKCNPFTIAGQSRSVFQFEIINPVFGRYIVLMPKKWNNWPTIRVDFYYDEIVNQPNCKQYSSSGKCRQCDQNFTSINGKCRVVVPGCQSMGEADGQCLKCFDSYYLRKNKGCELRKPGCNYLADGCSSCIEGYKFRGGQCEVCSDLMHKMSEISKPVASSIGVNSSLLFAGDCLQKGGWQPQRSVAGEWIGLEASKSVLIYSLEVMPGAYGYLESFYLKYTLDNHVYENVPFIEVFQANSQENRQTVRISLLQPLQARGIRIYPLKWSRSINFNFEFYYYERSVLEWERNRKGLFSDIGDMMYSQRVNIFEMNPRINENGTFTLPADSANWMGFSTSQDKNQRVNLVKMYVRGSELKDSWIDRLFLMVSYEYGRKFECYQNCQELATSLNDTSTIVTLPLTDLKDVTDVRVFPTAYHGAKSMRVDFEVA